MCLSFVPFSSFSARDNRGGANNKPALLIRRVREGNTRTLSSTHTQYSGGVSSAWFEIKYSYVASSDGK